MTDNIHYIIAPSSFGFVLSAQSDKGICAILIGDTQRTLIDDLKKRFPLALIEQGDHACEASAKKIVNYVDRPMHKLDIKLDIRGTDFQKQVWRILQKIPLGSTTTYGDIAKAMGKPKAFRAVATACAANAHAVIIPCHRVVRSDGGLSGYRWGVARKQLLLEIEGVR